MTIFYLDLRLVVGRVEFMHPLKTAMVVRWRHEDVRIGRHTRIVPLLTPGRSHGRLPPLDDVPLHAKGVTVRIDRARLLDGALAGHSAPQLARPERRLADAHRALHAERAQQVLVQIRLNIRIQPCEKYNVIGL